MNFYNEIDPKAAAWLRELIAEGHIPRGHVDERSITDIQPDELADFTQHHFFAGIGGWSLALRLAGWANSRPVWTGSCPCQPFSTAGRGKAQADERHLWPAFFRLIRECRPEFVFGEQVEAAIGHGWLDGVSADMEGEGYAVGAAVLGAHSVGAPHLRQRLYWLAYAESQRKSPIEGGSREGILQLNGGCTTGAVAHAGSERRVGKSVLLRAEESERGAEAILKTAWSGTTFWSDFDILPCLDGKSRRTKSGLLPLADGLPGRMGLLRGAGNAIIPEVAAQFIRASEEAI